MSNLELLWYPHKGLRDSCRTLGHNDILTNEFVENVSYMFRVMYYKKGVGLAAPQVGWNVKLFIANPFGRPNHLTHSRVFINPTITPIGDDVTEQEGCLSFPDIYANVKRKEEVIIRSYSDHKMKVKDEKFTGFMARIIQHEYDHLKGILFIDRISKEQKKLIENSLEIHKRNVKKIRKEKKKREKEEAKKKKAAECKKKSKEKKGK